MPGPFIYMSSMRHATLRLVCSRCDVRGRERVDPCWTGVDIKQISSLLQQFRNFASLGAINLSP